MGAQQSKPEQHSKPAKSPVIQQVQTYVEQGKAGLLSVRRCVSQLASSHLDEMRAILDEKDLEKWKELLQKKKMFISEIQVFAMSTGRKLKIVVDRVKKPDEFEHLSACYEGWSKEDTLTKAKALQNHCNNLRCEFDSFKADFEHKYRVNKSKVERIAGAVALTVAAIAAIVLFVLHVVPGVNFVLAPIAIIAVSAIGGASGIAGGAMWFSKSEVEKISDFLNNIEQRLKELRNSLSRVRSNCDALTMAKRKEIEMLFNEMIAECDKIVDATDGC